MIPLVAKTRGTHYAHNFYQKISFEFETKEFLIKTAQSYEELEKVFKLRHQVFFEDDHERMGQWEFDSFDFQCDHLLVFDKLNAARRSEMCAGSRQPPTCDPQRCAAVPHCRGHRGRVVDHKFHEVTAGSHRRPFG